MPNVIWSSTSKVKDGRGAEAVTRALKLKQVFVDAGAISARYFNSTAGPDAPSSTFAVEFTSLAHMDEVFGKFGQDAWAQEAYFNNTDQPSTQIAQGLLFEVE